jgi:hypothetical protein
LSLTYLARSMDAQSLTISASWWWRMTATLSGQKLCWNCHSTGHRRHPRQPVHKVGPTPHPHHEPWAPTNLCRVLLLSQQQQICTAYYSPQANGGVERFNQTLKNGIKVHLVQGCTFQTALNQTLMHYRASKHTTTQISPASLMLDREMELPLDRLRTQTMAAPATRSPKQSR